MSDDATARALHEAATSPVVPTRFRWAQRLGLLGFLFFFIKGLAWVAVLARTWWFA